MAYTPRQRASALRLVAAQGYAIAAGMTGISESSLRQWAKDAAVTELARRERAVNAVLAGSDQIPGDLIGPDNPNVWKLA